MEDFPNVMNKTIVCNRFCAITNLAFAFKRMRGMKKVKGLRSAHW